MVQLPKIKLSNYYQISIVCFTLLLFTLSIIFVNPDARAQLESSCSYGSSRLVDIPYEIIGDKVTEFCKFDDGESLSIILDVEKSGEITIKIPRILLDVKTNDCQDDSFFILIDGEELQLDRKTIEIKEKKFRTLTIPLKEGNKEIQIINPILISMTSIEPTLSECKAKLFSEFPPLKQIKYGVIENEIICKDNLYLIFKSVNNSPACVSEESVEKLIQRGWAKS